MGNNTKITARGWICPFCNTAYAPWIESCKCSTNQKSRSKNIIPWESDHKLRTTLPYPYHTTTLSGSAMVKKQETLTIKNGDKESQVPNNYNFTPRSSEEYDKGRITR